MQDKKRTESGEELNISEFVQWLIDSVKDCIQRLDEGTYNVIATYNGDKNYLSSSTTYQLNVSKIRAKLNVEIRDRNVNDTISITAKLISANNENISGNISVEVDGKSYRMAIQNGEGFLNIGKLEIGNYHKI